MSANRGAAIAATPWRWNTPQPLRHPPATPFDALAGRTTPTMHNPDLSGLLEMGLTEYEARTYQALLRQSHLSATELIKVAAVPRGSIYDVLNQLVQKGFCSVVPSSVKKYVAVPPALAIQGLIEERRATEAAAHERWIEQALVLEKLREECTGAPAPLDYFHVLTSRPGLVRRAEEMENSAHTELRSFNMRPWADSRLGTRPSVRAAVERGVRDRSIFELEPDDPKHFLEMLRAYALAGVEVRVAESLPLKMLIVDADAVMISLRDLSVVSSSLTSLLAEHSELTAAMIELFEVRWQLAQPLAEFEAQGRAASDLV